MITNKNLCKQREAIHPVFVTKDSMKTKFIYFPNGSDESIIHLDENTQTSIIYSDEFRR